MSNLTVPKDKRIIGLTGNIATGKSTIMRLAAEHGALTLDADKVVHEILDNDTAVQTGIVDTFGSTVRLADGRINRAVLGKIVFNEPQSLGKLEQIVHPAVHQKIILHIEQSESPIIMIEAIKLLEGKLHLICQQIWVTRCSRERQLERLRICRGMDKATAVARIDAQRPQEEKVAQADIVIDTDGLMDDTRKQFEQAWSNLPLPER
jgi:dephospho-CoA kinase